MEYVIEAHPPRLFAAVPVDLGALFGIESLDGSGAPPEGRGAAVGVVGRVPDLYAISHGKGLFADHPHGDLLSPLDRRAGLIRLLRLRLAEQLQARKSTRLNSSQ